MTLPWPTFSPVACNAFVLKKLEPRALLITPVSSVAVGLSRWRRNPLFLPGPEQNSLFVLNDRESSVLNLIQLAQLGFPV
jgi:hypothetical protein